MKRLLPCLLAALFSAAGQGTADRVLPRLGAPEVLWHAPRRATIEDWQCTFAGCSYAPVPPFHFVKGDSGGTTAKITVQDAKGRSYSVKFGGKLIPDSFASRFVPALGYTVEPSYAVGPGKIEGVPSLHLVSSYVKRDGSFERARFQLRDPRYLDFVKGRAWSLVKNPFTGTHQLAGLRVVIMLLSDWDTKDLRNGQESSNTGVFRTSIGGPELRYSFFDWGDSLGRWGGLMHRTRSDCSGFALETPKFIRGVRRGDVEWGYSGKRTGDITRGITVEDLRWLAPYLARITDAEIRIGLKASGATERQTACWAGALEDRMRQIETTARLGR